MSEISESKVLWSSLSSFLRSSSFSFFSCAAVSFRPSAQMWSSSENLSCEPLSRYLTRRASDSLSSWVRFSRSDSYSSVTFLTSFSSFLRSLSRASVSTAVIIEAA